jgi:WD40 repeat protein
MKSRTLWLRCVWPLALFLVLLLIVLAASRFSCRILSLLSEPLGPEYNGYRDIAWSPDGRIIAVAGQGVFIFNEDLEEIGFLTGEGIREEPENAYSLTWSPDSSRLAVAFSTGISIVSVDGFVEHRSGLSGSEIAWSPSADLLAVRSNDFRKKGEYYIYEVYGGGVGTPPIPVLVLQGHENWITVFEWSSDGQRIATASTLDGSIRVWDAASGEQMRILHSPPTNDPDYDAYRNSFSLSWKPDSRYLATSNIDDDYIRILNVETGEEAQKFPRSSRYVYDLVWSPDRHVIAILNERGVSIHDADTGQLVRTCDIPEKGHVSQVVWNPTGTRLVGIGAIGMTRYVWLWNAETGDLLNAFSS